MTELYQGEILGEILIEAFITEYPDHPYAQRFLETLLQAESETKARLRPAMVRMGLPLATAQPTRDQAQALLPAFTGLAWPEFLQASLAAVRDTFVPRYQEIARIAEADGDPIAIEVANYM